MKSYSILLGITISILLAVNCYAQPGKKESYKSIKSRSSSGNIEQLLHEAEDLKTSNPSKALDQVQEALAMSLAQGEVLYEATCYVLLGEINEGIREWGLALDNYERAHQKLLKNYEESPEFHRALRGLGNTNLMLSNYDKALSYFQETLDLLLTSSERTDRQLNVSEVYFQMGKYDEALKAAEAAEGTSKVRKAPDARIQSQKAKIYAKKNDLGRANDYYISSQNTVRSAVSRGKADDEAIQNSKEEISDALKEQKRYDEDIVLRNQSIDYNLESSNLGEVSKDKIELSKTLAAKGETNKAIRELEEAAFIADTINNPKEQATAFLNLASLYEKNGKSSQALATYKKYSQAVARSEEQNELASQARSELIRKQKDIEALTKDVAVGQREETIEQTTLQRQRLVIYGLLFIIVLFCVASYFIYKNAMASKRANQLLALKSLRSQMNPHFIFNALNSVNHFVSQNDERTANKFLSDFSRLMRLVLENSQEDFISFQKEEEIISLYLKLEHYRFRDKFDYTISIDEDINPETIELPPMLIQPYIENAVWHGLRYKEEKGHLTLHVKKQNASLLVEISDDGIGRKKSGELKTENQKKHSSTGLKNIRERLGILNKVYKTDYQVSIEDLHADYGTRVTITVPLQNGK